MMSPLLSLQDANAQLQQGAIYPIWTRMADISTGQLPPLPAYRIGHAPVMDFEKTFADPDSELPHTLPTYQRFYHHLKQLELPANVPLLVYDYQGMRFAPRAWWMFCSMGYQIRLLNGDFNAWFDAGLPVTPLDDSTTVKQDQPSVAPCWALPDTKRLPQYWADKHDVLIALDDPNIVIIDARSQARYLAQVPEPRPGMQRGHIPGALNIPFDSLLNSHGMADKKVLEARFASLGIGQDQALIVYCGSGVTACVVALAARVCGFSRVRVYDGSWSEWGKEGSGLPISR
ncbi:sulfurtransferase [Aestuariibacter halophilus]|uniref:Sulfurtransferase n=1 Tax=Fluctibacter halophilus TaxID=226011 RepID=A0ABS8G562_9ALTE|nr:sulfurtransferase [Aestuariibacter halophilus]MCC2615727.1 sulfurtransferase [Aestuariibacter halophilus]